MKTKWSWGVGADDANRFFAAREVWDLSEGNGKTMRFRLPGFVFGAKA